VRSDVGSTAAALEEHAVDAAPLAIAAKMLRV
jgi:hypothetical protein